MQPAFDHPNAYHHLITFHLDRYDTDQEKPVYPLIPGPASRIISPAARHARSLSR